MSKPTCPLCRALHLDLLFEKHAIPYFQCARCRFIFSTPATNANFAPTLTDFGPAYLSYLQGDSPHRRRELRALHEVVTRYTDLENRLILDVGCGGGQWVRHLRSQGYLAYGVEPSTVVFNHFLRGEDYFYAGDIQSYAAGTDKRFDVITAFDVLEHLEAPIPFLQTLATLASPQAWVVLSFPDVGSLPARVLGKQWHYYNKYHLSYFSQSTLERAATQLGYQVVDTFHKGRYQSLGYIVDYLWEFVFNKRITTRHPFLDSLVFPVNFYDIRYVVLQLR